VDNIIGIVTNSETKQGDRKDGKGKWTRYAFQLKDARGVESWYSCFDQAAREVEVGTAYEFAYEVNGDYKNLSTWMTVDADAHGLSMSTPVVNNQDEFRRSKEEMRWTEAYHMATRILPVETCDPWDNMGKTQTSLVDNWAKHFYVKLETSDILTQTLHPVPETPVEAPVEERTIKTPRKPRSTAKSEAKSKAVEVPEPVSIAPDYQLFKTFNDARVAADMSMEDVNEYIEKTYKIDTVRKLSEVQLGDVIRHIEEMKSNA